MDYSLNMRKAYEKVDNTKYEFLTSKNIENKEKVFKLGKMLGLIYKLFIGFYSFTFQFSSDTPGQWSSKILMLRSHSGGKYNWGPLKRFTIILLNWHCSNMCRLI